MILYYMNYLRYLIEMALYRLVEDPAKDLLRVLRCQR